MRHAAYIDDTRLAQLRSETPTCESLAHFNNAGASLMPDPVYRATLRHLERERCAGGYEAAEQAHAEIEDFYDAFAELLRVGRGEIAYVENATRAWDMAVYALPLREGDRIITHESEYASNYLAFLQLAKRRGVEVDLAPSDGSGQIDVDRIAEVVTPRTRVIAINHVPTQGGLVNPAEEVGAVAREFGLTYVLDACQSVGQIELDVRKIGCHILSGTGRKFLRGPRGTGFLFVSDAILNDLDPPFIDLHAAKWTDDAAFEFAPGAKRFENWESFVAGRIGLAAAARYALDIGLDAIAERVSRLGRQLRSELDNVKGVSTHDRGDRRCAIVTFAKSGVPARDLAHRLRASRINVSVIIREHARLDLGRRGLEGLVRASVHYFNTEEEIARLIEVVRAV
jgi:selenocysteine lyase/cysteine desulfurase